MIKRIRATLNMNMKNRKRGIFIHEQAEASFLLSSVPFQLTLYTCVIVRLCPHTYVSVFACDTTLAQRTWAFVCSDKDVYQLDERKTNRATNRYAALSGPRANTASNTNVRCVPFRTPSTDSIRATI